MRILEKRGFSLVELMVSMGILVAMMGSVFLTMLAGRASWFETDVQMQLRESIRRAEIKLSKELHETGAKSGTMRLTLQDGAGVNSSDVIRFSIPVICESGGTIMDVNGDVANWGAPLTWGCTSSTCMDADDDCSTVDYEALEYRINSSNQLVRRVLDDYSVTFREDVFATNITDFQVVIDASQTVATVTLSASMQSNVGRQLSVNNTVVVRLRN